MSGESQGLAYLLAEVAPHLRAGLNVVTCVVGVQHVMKVMHVLHCAYIRDEEKGASWVPDLQPPLPVPCLFPMPADGRQGAWLSCMSNLSCKSCLTSIPHGWIRSLCVWR